ncbi:MAG: DNA repair protein RecO [Clostridia bacterium]|nr:DNA repair protein RecO [Clostridia bacterium]
MTIKINGLVLKISETVHENRLLFILTEDRGRIQVFDNRYKSGGKKRSALDLYTYCEFVLYENNGKYTLNSATVLETFFELRGNLSAATLAGYFSQLCLFATQDETMFQKELLSLTLNALYLLCKQPEEIHKVKAVFEWKIIRYIGFTPSLGSCAHVSFENDVLFSLEDGGMYCKSCLPSSKNAPAFRITAAQVKAIGFVLEQPPAKAFSFRLGENSIMELGKIAEEYLSYHSGQSFSALDLYKMLG